MQLNRLNITIWLRRKVYGTVIVKHCALCSPLWVGRIKTCNISCRVVFDLLNVTGCINFSPHRLKRNEAECARIDTVVELICYRLVPDTLKPKISSLGKSPDLSLIQAAGVEGILTFNLILVALSVTSPGKHTILHTLTIGCCKATGLLAAVS